MMCAGIAERSLPFHLAFGENADCRNSGFLKALPDLIKGAILLLIGVPLDLIGVIGFKSAFC